VIDWRADLSVTPIDGTDMQSRSPRGLRVLSAFFEPASIAVVGASDDPAKLRGKVLKLLRDSGFPGPIYPVHPTAATIQGLTAYPDVAAIPGGAELVLVVTPGETVPAVVAAAAEAGAKAAVVLSSGVDPVALQAAATSAGLRYMGPNTEGYFQVGGVAATFAAVVEEALGEAEAPSRPGRPVSIVSQSGGLGFALYGRGRRESLDFKSVITTGNEGDLECLDFVDHLLDEGESGVILMFIEGLKTPRRLAAVAAKAADRGVPLVVMKIGRSEAGQRAAVSHTAHLTGADTAYDAVFERYGVIRVFDHEEMLATAAALSRFRHGRVRKVAIVTTSGGAGAWAADLCGMAGVDTPLLSAGLQAELAAHIPAFGSAANPIDVTAQAVEDGGRTLLKVLERLERTDEVDAVIVNMGLAKPRRIEALKDVLGPILAAARKPILFHSHILPIDENMAALARLGAQGFHSLRGCAAALRALDRHAAFLDRWSHTEAPAPPGPPRIAPTTAGVLGDADVRRLLDAYTIPTPPDALARTRDEAVAAGARLGGPLVMKIQSRDIPHKTEAGGVALGVAPADVGPAFDRIVATAARHVPGARLDGVLLQKMAAKGHEVVIGVVRDPDFGPLVMLGSGGIYLEVLKDVVFAPPPISKPEALRLIARLKTAPILQGARGQAPADLDALAELVVRVAELARSETAIDQLDLNPVFVHPCGQGVTAVDVLAVAGDPAGFAQPQH
jgi:acyl-CoA synthetase (NDP forming)